MSQEQDMPAMAFACSQTSQMFCATNPPQKLGVCAAGPTQQL
jgi:hypothetical protein